MFYRSVVQLNKNESVAFEAATETKLMTSMRNTLASDRYANDTVTNITIYEVHEIANMTYAQLMERDK